jgi:hypothetical protein
VRASTTEWPAIIDTDTHEQLARLFSDLARRKHVVGRKYHLPSGLAPCLRCGHGLKYRMFPARRMPLDIGYSDHIPGSIRRAVISRDQHCAWAGGCDRRPAGSDVHHITHNGRGRQDAQPRTMTAFSASACTRSRSG